MLIVNLLSPLRGWFIYIDYPHGLRRGCILSPLRGCFTSAATVLLLERLFTSALLPSLLLTFASDFLLLHLTS